MIIKTQSFIKPKLKLIVKEGEDKEIWDKFKEHHYMDDTFPRSAVFYTFYWVKDDKEILVGCCGVLFQIAKFQKARRFTRIVVLPEYQGLGIGSLMINAIARYYKDEGINKVYVSTFHPRLGEYMEHSNNWTPSINNMMEFKQSEVVEDKAMSGLRDGVAMYRYNFIGCQRYRLLYNPVLITSLRRELKNIPKDSDEYRNKSNILENELLLVNIKKKEVIIEAELTVEDEAHKLRKEEHKLLFNKNKRKPLTSEERKKLKAMKAIEKDLK